MSSRMSRTGELAHTTIFSSPDRRLEMRTVFEQNKSWRANRPEAFQFHFNFHSIAPVGAHQTLGNE
jgi:hypothetical protein